jgi:hypothetical protein
MTNTKFATGAFVFTRARGLQPRDPDDLQPIARQHNIDPAFVPSYAGDRVALGRAIAQSSSGLTKEGFLLRPITRSASEVVYGIVHEQRDEADQRLEHEFAATVAWSGEPDPALVRGDHPIARRVADAYGELRGKVVADDWSSSVTSYLESHDAARVAVLGRCSSCSSGSARSSGDDPAPRRPPARAITTAPRPGSRPWTRSFQVG